MLFLNVIFEFCFKYSFYTEIGLLYFVLSAIFVCLYFINEKKYANLLKIKLPYLLFVVTIIICTYNLKVFFIPFIAIPLIDIIKSNIHKVLKILFTLVSCIFLILLILMYVYFLHTTSVINFVISEDGKYVAVVENIDLGATGGETDVYVGRNINLGVLGYYSPRKLKYHGHIGDSPEIEFIKGNKIIINNETIDIKGEGYIDDY